MQSISGTLADDGVSQRVFIEPGETIAVVLSVADMELFEGVASVEVSRDGVNFTPAIDANGAAVLFTGEDMDELDGEVFNGILTNTDSKRVAFRVRAHDVAEDALVYSLTEIIGDRTGVILRDKNGVPVMWSRDDGTIEVAGITAATVNPNAILATFEALASNPTTPSAVDLTVYETRVTTTGSEAAEEITLGDGTGAVVGQRKLITGTLGHANDAVTLDHANMADVDGGALAAVSIDATGGFVLVEWNGTAWQVIYSGDATVTGA
jgi:hypothetical protein